MASYVHASEAHIASALPQKANRGSVWLILIAGAVLGMAILAIAGYLMRPQPFHCTNPVQCGTAPPLKVRSDPLPPADSFTSSKYGFSVAYPGGYSPDKTTNVGIAWSGDYNEGPAEWVFVGDSANGRSAEQVVNSLQSKFSGASFVYSIPDANIGYVPGYGAVYDLHVNDGGGQSVHQRLVVMSAINGSVAVSFIGAGPFVRSSLQNDGHPNPAETPLVHEDLFRQAIEGVTWHGEPAL